MATEEVEIIEANAPIAVAYEYQPAVISADFDTMRQKALDYVKEYEGMTLEEVALMDLKVAKACRADLNKAVKELNDARIAVSKEYNKPLNEFKKNVDEIIAILKEPWAILDEGVKKAEEDAKNRRYEALEQTYEEFCPLLVPMVPFDRILDPKWLTKSFGEKKAEIELCDKAAKIAKDWDILKGSNLACPTETEIEFFKTLDVSAALAYDKQRKAEIDALNELKAEVEYDPEEDEQVQDTMTSDDGVYTFTIEIPRTEFKTTIIEATALKNHLKLLGIEAKMTRFVQGE